MLRADEVVAVSALGIVAGVDDAEVVRLVDEVRTLDDQGATDDAIAEWLKARTANFGESGRILALARSLSHADAYAALHGTETWQRQTTWYRLVYPDGAEGGQFASPNGRMFSVGDHLNLPSSPERPYRSEPGRGTVWKVAEVDEPDDDAAFTVALRIEPIRRLEERPDGETG